jgi:PAS domain S-box-containing protein
VNERSLRPRGSTGAVPDPFFVLSPDMLCVVGADGYFQRLNPRWADALGVPEETLLARPLEDFIHPDDRAAVARLRPQFEVRFRCGDGGYRWLSWKTSAPPGAEAHYCIVHDVTERKITERRLAMQFAVTRALSSPGTVAEAARALLQAVGEAEGWEAASFFRLDERTQELCCEAFWHAPDKRVTEFERITRRTHFLPGEGVLGRVFVSREAIWMPDVAKDERFQRAFWAAKEGLRAACCFPILADADVVGVIELVGSRVREPDPILREMMASVGSQVGQFLRRRAAEEALRTAEARLRSVVAHAPIGLFAFDRQGRVTFSDGRGLDPRGPLRGITVGASLGDCAKELPALLDVVQRAMRGETLTATVLAAQEARTYEICGTPVLGADGEVVEVIGVATDVTYRTRAAEAQRHSEARLVEAHRIASISALASRVACEIEGATSHARAHLAAARSGAKADAGGEARATGDLDARLAAASAAVEHVAWVGRELEAFARGGEGPPAPVDLREVLEESVALAAAHLHARASVTRAYGEVSPVLGSASRLVQAFLSLVVHASLSTLEDGRGDERIHITTRADAASGRVIVELTDGSVGMTPEVMKRIFEPSFLGGAPDMGAGLGLSIGQGIIASMGGEIAVESRLGEGTTFRVTLPALPASPPAPAARERHAEPPLTASRAAPPRMRVLVLDDELVLANALGRTLEPDFEVTVLTSSREALRKLREGADFDAILCDLIMPGVTGMDLHEELSKTRPALAERMVFMTGGTFTARARDFIAERPTRALEKPFEMAALVATLKGWGRAPREHLSR